MWIHGGSTPWVDPRAGSWVKPGDKELFALWTMPTYVFIRRNTRGRAVEPLNQTAEQCDGGGDLSINLAFICVSCTIAMNMVIYLAEYK